MRSRELLKRLLQEHAVKKAAEWTELNMKCNALLLTLLLP